MPGSMEMKSPAVFSTTCHLEADVDVREGDAARRNRRDVHRERLRAHVLRRQSFL
jgi:hypothetical protein